MFGKKIDERKKSGTSLIASNMEFVGDIFFNDQLVVEGKIKGRIYANPESLSLLTISTAASVVGTVEVPTVHVNGAIEGCIHAGKSIMLGAKSDVTGDIIYKTIQVEKGAKVNGNLMHVSRLPEPVNQPAEVQEKDPETVPDLHAANNDQPGLLEAEQPQEVEDKVVAQ